MVLGGLDRICCCLLSRRDASLVENGLGVSVLPSLVLKRNPYHIKLLHLEEPAFRNIRVITRPDISKIASKFLEYLKYRNETVED